MGTFSFSAKAEEAAPEGPPPPPPGLQVTPYAHVSVWTGVDSKSHELMRDATDGVRNKTSSQLTMTLPIGPTPSGIGVKGSLGGLSVVAEVGIGSKNWYAYKDAKARNPGPYYAGEGNSFGINEVSATYKFDSDLSLQFGHFFSPATFAGINPFHDKTNGGFMIYEGAQFDTPQIQAKLAYKGFYLDVAKPGDSGYYEDEATYFTYKMPKVSVGYVSPGPIQATVNFTFQNVRWENQASATADYPGYSISTVGKDVTAYSASAGVNAFMPWGIAHAFAFYSQNDGNMGVLSLVSQSAYTTTSAMFDGTDIKNTTGFGGNAGISYRFGKFEPGIGGSYVKYKNDLLENDEDVYTAFFSLQYALDNHISITPAVKYRNFGKYARAGGGPLGTGMEGTSRGSEILWGIMWSATTD